MTVTIDDLVDCVNRNDAVSFLLVYLELLQDGCTLTLPSATAPKRCAFQWKGVVPTKCSHGTEAFFNDLAVLWIEIAEDNNLTERDAILDALIKKLKFKHKELSQIKEDGAVFRSGGDIKLKEVSASISDDYTKEHQLRSQKGLSKTDAHQKVKLALQKKDAYDFFDYYLQHQLAHHELALPNSTVLLQIRSFWNRIIQANYQIVPDEDFIKEISAYSFYLANTLGIPRTAEDVKNAWVAFKKKYKKEKKTAPKKKSLFRRLFL